MPEHDTACVETFFAADLRRLGMTELVWMPMRNTGFLASSGDSCARSNGHQVAYVDRASCGSWLGRSFVFRTERCQARNSSEYLGPRGKILRSDTLGRPEHDRLVADREVVCGRD